MKLGTLRVEGITRFAEPVEIDFAALGPGVIAITGDNGSGKTSITECAGPGVLFRRFPFRDPSGIQNWIRPGGARVTLSFSHGGGDYFADLQIEDDADKTQTGVLKRAGAARPLSSGKVRDYDREIEKILGPREAFLAGNFATQGGAGAFSGLDVATRKAVFRYYLRLDRIEALAKAVGKKLAGHDGEKVDRLDVELQGIENDRIPDVDGRLQAAIKSVEGWGRALKTSRDRFSEVAEKAALRDLIDAYETALDGAGTAVSALDAVRADDPKWIGDHDLAALRKAVIEAREGENKVNGEIRFRDGRRRDLGDAKAALDRACKAVDSKTRVPCKGEGIFASCPFLGDARTAEGDVPNLSKTFRAISDEVEKLDEEDFDGKRTEARNRLEGAEKLLRAGERADAWGRRLQGAKEALRRARATVFDLAGKLPDPVPTDLPSREDVDALKRKVEEAEEKHGAAVRVDAALRAELDGLNARRTELRKALATAKTEADDVRALRALAWGLGPNGIQAFEIDAAGPRVSTIANDLLLACYGPRFTLSIKTLKELSSREGVKEDFEVHVWDEANGIEHGSIDALSGGERVIVDEALRNALALFARERSGGSPIETLYRDEPDAALSESHGARYALMLRRAREIGGFHQLLWVTHSPNAREIADAEIHVTDEGRIEIS